MFDLLGGLLHNGANFGMKIVHLPNMRRDERPWRYTSASWQREWPITDFEASSTFHVCASDGTRMSFWKLL